MKILSKNSKKIVSVFLAIFLISCSEHKRNNLGLHTPPTIQWETESQEVILPSNQIQVSAILNKAAEDDIAVQVKMEFENLNLPTEQNLFALTILKGSTQSIFSINLPADIKVSGDAGIVRLILQESNQASVSGWTVHQVMIKEVALGLDFIAAQVPPFVAFTSPLVVENGSLKINQTIPDYNNVKLGGRAVYKFKVQESGMYRLLALAKAPDTAQNSFFVAIDEEPIFPNHVWDIIAPSTFSPEQRIILRGLSGQNPGNEPLEKYLTKDDTHQLVIIGREPGCEIKSFRFEKIGDANLPALISEIVDFGNTGVSQKLEAVISGSTPSKVSFDLFDSNDNLIGSSFEDFSAPYEFTINNTQNLTGNYLVLIRTFNSDGTIGDEKSFPLNFGSASLKIVNVTGVPSGTLAGSTLIEATLNNPPSYVSFQLLDSSSATAQEVIDMMSPFQYDLQSVGKFPNGNYTLNVIAYLDGNAVDQKKYSFAIDNTAVPPPPPPPPTASLTSQAMAILQNKCMTCHTQGFSYGDFSRYIGATDLETDKKWAESVSNLGSAYVIPRDAANSYLFKKLKLQGGNMPLTADSTKQITSPENTILFQWINQIAPIEPLPGGGSVDKLFSGFSCQNPSAPNPMVNTLKRLSKVEYINTLRDILANLKNATNEKLIWDQVLPVTTGIPDDTGELVDDFANSDRKVGADHVNAYSTIAAKFAITLSESTAPDFLTPFVTNLCTATTKSLTNCVSSFIDNFGLRIFRRPVTSTEKTSLTNYFNDSTGPSALNLKYRDLIARFLISPDFLNHVQAGGAAVSAVYTLTNYEIISKLSFHFWQTMPDNQLFLDAASSSFSSNYSAIVSRVFNDAKTKRSTTSFYEEWLKYSDVPNFTSNAKFNEFAKGEHINEAGYNHRADMIQEIREMTEHYTWTTNGTYNDLLTSKMSFAKTPALAGLYDDVLYPNQFSSGTRSGLMSRAAFLVSGGSNTKPMHRGLFVRRTLLCDTIAPPNPLDLPEGSIIPPPVSTTLTTRQRFEGKFENSTTSSSCMGCHSQIDPFGYGLEKYDALGRFRNVEIVLNDQGTNITSPNSGLYIDASVKPKVFPEDQTPVNGPAEIADRISQSGKAHACFVRRYFSYSEQRSENLTESSCVMERLRQKLVGSGGTIKSFMMQIALEPEFKLRKIVP